MAVGRQNQKHARKRAVEMPGLWKAWKAKTRLPPLSTAPWKSRQDRRDSHISTAPTEAGDGKVENQKQVSHFPTATNPFFQKPKTGPAGGLRPPPGGGRFAPPQGVKE